MDKLLKWIKDNKEGKVISDNEYAFLLRNIEEALEGNDNDCLESMVEDVIERSDNGNEKGVINSFMIYLLKNTMDCMGVVEIMD